MRRLITLLLGLAGAAAAVRIVLSRRSGGAEPLSASVMPRPTAAPAAEGAPTAPGEAGQPTAREVVDDPPTPDIAPLPVNREEPAAVTESDTSADTAPGPIDEGEPGAITAAPVPDESEAAAAEPAPDDATLERAVESEIAEDPAVPDESVEVEVEGGVAQLRGSVPDDQTATRIGDDAARVDGVIGLDDQLERPDEPGAAPKDDPERSEE